MKLAREGNLNTVAPPVLKHLIDDEPDESSPVHEDLTGREAMSKSKSTSLLYNVGIRLRCRYRCHLCWYRVHCRRVECGTLRVRSAPCVAKPGFRRAPIVNTPLHL